MDQALIDRIKSVGFWRVNIRPMGDPSRVLDLAECRRLVDRNQISLRGWNYPHVSRVDNHGGDENMGDFVQNWTEWYQHVEFWRMYRSGQFLHYKALREDLMELDEKPEAKVLGTGTSIFTMTEIVEFAFRLRAAGLYERGMDIAVVIGNTSGRQLWIDDPGRMGFSYPRQTHAESIKLERRIDQAGLEVEPREIALGMIVELFDQFDWTPNEDQIRADQIKLYNLRF
ncbi:hypothetical protein [Rhizobium laguerreae]|uniref:hypothetical protein n=1 Tax=Rhizobium laguerreae TaxID=1076926 RepID=UPI001C914F4F|nr:hypothetical protein [Rhizobium laguerreae]MBY3138991.1 hypothetical protein [Rhizobium laguerreae]